MAVESPNERIEQLLSAARAIYIIDSAGILLFHEFFIGQNDDPDLYSGLFAAVNVYAKELKVGSIKFIRLPANKFIFSEHLDTGYLIVLDVDNLLSETDATWLLGQIVKRFDAITKLKEDDFQGSLILETLFEDRGKEINWNMIHSIREDAIADQKLKYDNVETLNLTRVNLNNRTWVKIRKMISTVVENQKGLKGAYLFIQKRDHLNQLYAGREREPLEELFIYLNKKVEGGIGLELEPEMVNMDDIYSAIFPLLLEDGGIFAIASKDKYLVARLNNQIERLVAAMEKIGLSE